MFVILQSLALHSLELFQGQLAGVGQYFKINFKIVGISGIANKQVLPLCSQVRDYLYLSKSSFSVFRILKFPLVQNSNIAQL